MSLNNIDIKKRFEVYDEMFEYLFKYVGNKKEVKKVSSMKKEDKIYLSTEGLIKIAGIEIKR
jgi:adenylate kinase family enzyme